MSRKCSTNSGVRSEARLKIFQSSSSAPYLFNNSYSHTSNIRIHQFIVATIATEEKLKIPVFDAAYSDTKGQNVGKIFNNLEILCHSIMQAMFDLEELKSLTIVKLDKSNPAPSQLRASIHEERKWHQVA